MPPVSEPGHLIENKGVRQRPDEGYRRWFLNSYFDLIFWYAQEDGELIGFQFCYGKPYNERAYTCGTGFQSHHFVSSRDTNSKVHTIGTAVLQGDAGAIPPRVVQRFKRERGQLDQELARIVLEKIGAFNTAAAG